MELVAPGEYMVRPPQAPVYVFVIDVSYAAVASGMLAQVEQQQDAQGGGGRGKQQQQQEEEDARLI